MFLTKTVSYRRAILLPKLLIPVSCTSEIERLLGTEVRKVRWKGSIKITPRKLVSLSQKSSDTRVPRGNSSYASDDVEIPPYVDVDPYHPKLVRMLTAVKTKRQRYSNMMIMLEGKRLITEALAADIKPLLILFSRKKLLKGLPLDSSLIEPEHTIVHRLHHRFMRTWSSVTTCPGLIGIFRMPNLEKNTSAVETLPITLVCDNLRDPGNLGSVLRVAAALPVEKVILLTGCADLWDPKVTRGSCGAMFHLKIFNNASWDDVNDECSDNVILADHEIEGKGTKEIEDGGFVEAENYNEELEDESSIVNNEDEDDDDDINKAEKLREKYNLRSKSYSDLTFKKNNSYTIVVGGETEGLSESSFQFASERNGIRANIPLAATVSSLNAATALGIISFEIKRQILKSES